jgi:hypothetical protein
MNIDCSDRERIFLDGTPEEWTALEAHAATCAPCREELAAWKSLSVTAQDLHRQWESPSLWPRIEQALRAEARRPRSSWWHCWLRGLNGVSFEWQTAVAGLLLCALTGAAVWITWQPREKKIPADQALFSNRTVREVERAEAAYEQAIDKLDAEARPELRDPATPLLAGYREKLSVLDSAIAELKSQASINPGNGHLRRQLLAMYQEKQDTLEQVLEAKQ